MAKVLYPKHIFENVGLSLSGGGYRAAGFHLGALSYLHHLKIGEESLLQKVKILSTISGGTIPGLMYALSLQRKRPFEAFYQKLYRVLEKDELLEDALDKLNHPEQWENGHKNKNLINAFAEVYNEHLFEQEHFQVFLDDNEMHIEELIFNATGFKTGNLFRFQKTKNDSGIIGNLYTRLSENVAREIRLADILASSSCFPGGFEPMEMPGDFITHENSTLAKFWSSKNWAPMGLMDGGIVDNQGINSVELAEQRRRKDQRQFLDLFIVSDVGSKMMAPFVFPEKTSKKWWGGIKLKQIASASWILSIFSLVGLGFSLFYGSIHTGFVILWSLLLTIGFLFIWAYRKVHETITSFVRTTLPGESERYLQQLKIIYNLPLKTLYSLLYIRLDSLLKINSDIFMKQIKTDRFSSMYSHPKWQKRFIVNLIYSIADVDQEDEDPSSLLPSKAMKEISNVASQMATTLWFTEKEEKNQLLKKLVACGQFTTCSGLIKYIQRLEKDQESGKVVFDKEAQVQLAFLKQQLLNDYRNFKQDPYALTNR